MRLLRCLLRRWLAASARNDKEREGVSRYATTADRNLADCFAPLAMTGRTPHPPLSLKGRGLREALVPYSILSSLMESSFQLRLFDVQGQLDTQEQKAYGK